MKILHSKGRERESGIKVFLAVPSYGGTCSGFTYSIFGSKEALIDAGIQSSLEIFDGNCHIDDARNRLVRDFLETDCTDFVFLDADLRFDPCDLLELVLADKDVIAGTYPLKQESEDYPVRFFPGEIASDKHGHIEVESVPTGFLKIRRHVLEKLYKSVPKFKVKADSVSRLKLPLIFERTMEGDTRWGGDYEFCRKWRKTGGKIYLIPEMFFGHEGSYEWKGSVANYLRRANGLQDVYIKESIEKIKKYKPSIKDIIGLCQAWNNEWATPEAVLIALSMIARETRGNILECGSGLSTLIIAASTDKQIDVLEHDREYFDNTEKYIKMCGLDNVNLRFCNIKDRWYESGLNGEKYSMVYVDGPPRDIGRDSFAVKTQHNLSKDCVVVADDCDSRLIDIWRKTLKFEYKQYGTERPFIMGKINA